MKPKTHLQMEGDDLAACGREVDPSRIINPTCDADWDRINCGGCKRTKEMREDEFPKGWGTR